MRRALSIAVATAAATCLVGAVLAPGAAGQIAAGQITAEQRDPSTAIDLQPRDRRQTVEGFGFSSAFQRAALLHQISEPQRSEGLDLLLGRDGAAPDILRIGIGGQSHDTYDVMLSIQPEDPGGPDAEPQYQWDGWDNGSVWFAQEARARGVDRFYGNAWTAPAYMKTNGSAVRGGTLCGLSDASCASGDWTEAYANYLVAWADLYAEEGIDIESIAFTNEPDWNTSYESMLFTPEQAAEFTGILGPIAQRSGYGVVCCDSFGWEQGKPYLDALKADKKAWRHLDVFSSHSYASRSATPAGTDKPVWMSEWAASNTAAGWNENWDGGQAVSTDGIVMAEHMHDSLAEAGVTAYLWWLGVSQGASASLIQADVAGDTYRVSSRYYVFSAFSRFIDPGAVRFDAEHEVDGLKVSAYRNPDGSRVVQLLNLNEAPVRTDIDLPRRVTTYLTDNEHDLERVDAIATSVRGSTELDLPARSLVTLVSGRG
ncbi:glycoside hydrolase family 30 protein [Promicromonospora iranensis]|uniref:glycoside hydrolase family 30 protein n=1 Tax=Promicromonospora iranensis TaxID=1105144 RepID=UPI0023A98919|nr:glycoside hydrolase [Promicromonospora iranensis]